MPAPKTYKSKSKGKLFAIDPADASDLTPVIESHHLRNALSRQRRIAAADSAEQQDLDLLYALQTEADRRAGAGDEVFAPPPPAEDWR